MGATVMEVTTNPKDTEAMEAINHKAMAAILIPMHLPRNTKNPTVLLILTPHLLKKPLKRKSKVKLNLQQHTKNLHLMEDISPLMAVTDLNLTVHPHLHLTVHHPQPMAVMAKPTHHLHLMNLMVHPHQHMAVMAKPTHHLHLMTLTVHLHQHMAVMEKLTHHLHLPHLIHPQHMEDIANPHRNLTVKPMVIKNPHMATLHHHPHLPHTGTATLHPRTASQPMEVMLPMINNYFSLLT